MTAGNTALRPKGFVVDVRSLHEAMEWARMLAATEMVPEGDVNKPANILVKMQIGAEIGLPPMQAIQKLYVIKGRVGMEVVIMLALVEGSGLLEAKTIERLQDDKGHDNGCRVTLQRKGRQPHTVTFTHADAVKAGLTTGRNKDTYARWDWRMYQNRALGFALQDEFPDVLRGIVSTDYLADAGDVVQVNDVPEAAEQAGPVRLAIAPPDAELEQLATTKMHALGMKPGARLAKLTAYRGRLPELLAELDKTPPKTAVPPAAKVEPKVIEHEPVIQVREEATAQDVVDGLNGAPTCPKCHTGNYSNPECDTCLDMQLAEVS